MKINSSVKFKEVAIEMENAEESHLQFQIARNKCLYEISKRKYNILQKYSEVMAQLTGLRTHVGKENLWYGWFGAWIILICYFLVFYTILYNIQYYEYIRTIENCCSFGILTYVSMS